MGGIAAHIGQKLSRDTTDFFYQFQLPRWCTAVTGACLIVRKELFFLFGGFDEAALKVAFNDVDFCLKLHEGGYHNTYIGDVELYHLESISRGCEDTPEKQARFQREISTMIGRWGEQLIWDPFYSAHYSRESSFPTILKANETPYLSKCYTWKSWEGSESYR